MMIEKEIQPENSFDNYSDDFRWIGSQLAVEWQSTPAPKQQLRSHPLSTSWDYKNQLIICRKTVINWADAIQPDTIALPSETEENGEKKVSEGK